MGMWLFSVIDEELSEVQLFERKAYAQADLLCPRVEEL